MLHFNDDDVASQRYRKRIEAILEPCDIRIDGDRPWDVQVRNEQFYSRIFSDGMLGVGEGYMDGWWECEQIDEMFCRAYRGQVNHLIRPPSDVLFALQARLMNLQRKTRAFQVGERHYDLGQDLFRAMLDKRMIYSCGYWKNADTLDEAQEHKLDLIARKLQLEPGMKVLDIGCGWGGALHYFADKYGVSGVGVTISRDQHATAGKLCADLPVEIRLQDYRELDERFDRIYSIGMFEHVGYKNYRAYLELVRRCLKPGALFLLHTIGSFRTNVKTDAWIDKYIFPNGQLPSVKQIANAADSVLSMEDWHNFPQDYDRTLMCWHDNFCAAWENLRGRYDERFFRMWHYYLLACAGGFRARGIQLWQIVFSADGVLAGYTPENVR